jgi:hypothetical protein
VGATTSQIVALREHLLAKKITCVVIESISDYLKPFYYLLDDALNMMLVNASQAPMKPSCRPPAGHHPPAYLTRARSRREPHSALRTHSQ